MRIFEAGLCPALRLKELCGGSIDYTPCHQRTFHELPGSGGGGKVVIETSLIACTSDKVDRVSPESSIGIAEHVKKTIYRMRNITRLSFITFLGCLMMAFIAGCDQEQNQNLPFQVSEAAESGPDRKLEGLTRYVNPFIGSEPLLDPAFIGYTPPENWRVWAGLTFPGPALPFAAVQMSPITDFGTGARKRVV